MNRLFKILFFVYCVLSIVSCNQKRVQLEPKLTPKFTAINENTVAGNTDFSNFIAIGDNPIAGMQGGALYNEGVKYSYPKILSEQFAPVGGGTFKQMNPNTDIGISNVNTANTIGPQGYIRLVTKDNVTRPTPLPNGEYLSTFTEDISGINNLGIPFLRVIDIKRKKEEVINPYLKRILPTPSSTYFDIISESKGTFYLIWFGVSDIVGWALSGGQGEKAYLIQNQRLRLDSYRYQSTLVYVDDFKENLNELLVKVFEKNSKGVILNCPDITSIPYFRTIPYNSIVLNKEETERISSSTIQDYNTVLSMIDNFKDTLPIGNSIGDISQRKISFSVGKNPILIKDSTLQSITIIIDSIIATLNSDNPNISFFTNVKKNIAHLAQVRLARSDDLILLPAGQLLNTPYNNNSSQIIGISYPLQDNYVLSKSEQDILISHINQFNATISELVTDLGLNTRVGILDTYKIFNYFSANKRRLVSFDPLDGFFSADGTHLNPRGNAILADSTLNLISKKFQSTFPRIDVSSFSGTPFPIVID